MFPCFPSGRHFHRSWRERIFHEVWSVDRPWAFLITAFSAVGQHLRVALEFLLCLHERERVAQSLVLDDRCLRDAFVFGEDAAGKRDTLPAHL